MGTGSSGICAPGLFSRSPRTDLDRLNRRNGFGFALLEVDGLACSTDPESMELLGDISTFVGSATALRAVDLSTLDPTGEEC